MDSVSELLEALHALTEVSKSKIRRRRQATIGDVTTPGMRAQLRWKKEQQAQRKAARHGPVARGRRKKRKQAYRDIARAQKLRRLMQRAG